MNVILLERSDYIAPNRVQLNDRRAQHIREILGANTEQTIKVGDINGLLGDGHIQSIGNNGTIELTVELNRAPPPKLPLTIILALPRPKMLRRIIRTVAEFGVRELVLLNTYKVEKSYWQTPVLAPEIIREYCIDGLQQSVDTVLPIIRCEKYFKPFVEDRLPAIAANTTALVAHPGTATPCPIALNQPCTLAIGPEGGFIPYEIEKLQQAGFAGVHLGARILRVENAATALVSRLFTS